MLKLNLLNPAQTDIPFSTTIFPDSQPHLKLQVGGLDTHQPVRIISRVSSPTDLLMILLANDVLQLEGFRSVSLDISYLLAARMDRVMTGGEPFALKVVGQMLNSAGFDRVRIFDPHSDVACAVINRAVPIDNIALISKAVEDLKGLYPDKQIVLVSPDAGALKKIYKVSHALQLEVAECMKIRDVATGQLSGFKVLDTDIKDKICLIADDICDGGGTFSGVAAVLKEHQPFAVSLAVSHGIFSKGFAVNGIDRIYTTDSYKVHADIPSHVKVYPVEGFM